MAAGERRCGVTAPAFRILVTASRTWNDPRALCRMLEEARGDIPHSRIVLVQGGAGGGDKMAVRYAESMDWGIETHVADWNGPCRPECKRGHRRTRSNGTDYCPAAGDYRNQAMVDTGADKCVGFAMPCALPDCTRPRPHDTHGAADCMERAEKAGIPVRRVTP